MSGFSSLLVRKTPDAAEEGIAFAYFFFQMSPNICFIFMTVALPPRCPPPTPWRFYLVPRITPTSHQCIIYKANLSPRDCRASERGRERDGLFRKTASDFLLICERLILEMIP